MDVRTLDLKFQGVPGTIAAYLVRGPAGWILVETGPASTDAALLEAMKAEGVEVGEVSNVFVTHIHLDHAGAAGLWSRRGARVHVHARGAPHLIDPAKLIASATRIYGDRMHELWGDLVPADPNSVVVVQDGEVVRVAGVDVRVLETAGHARHHHAFQIGDALFTGDAGGVRLCDAPFVDLPAPPPEFHLEDWLRSLDRLEEAQAGRWFPTHFGEVPDAALHIERFRAILCERTEAVVAWMREGRSRESIERRYAALHERQARDAGLDEEAISAFAVANPVSMSVTGILRYWTKIRGVEWSPDR